MSSLNPLSKDQKSLEESTSDEVAKMAEVEESIESELKEAIEILEKSIQELKNYDKGKITNFINKKIYKNDYRDFEEFIDSIRKNIEEDLSECKNNIEADILVLKKLLMSYSSTYKEYLTNHHTKEELKKLDCNGSYEFVIYRDAVGVEDEFAVYFARKISRYQNLLDMLETEIEKVDEKIRSAEIKLKDYHGPEKEEIVKGLYNTLERYLSSLDEHQILSLKNKFNTMQEIKPEDPSGRLKTG